MSIHSLAATSTRALIVFGALSLAVVAPAFAQVATPATPATPTEVPAPVPAPRPTFPTMSAADMFYTGVWAPTHWRATEAVGLALYNRTDERIGEVQELLIDGNGQVMAAIVGVGGFLGLGERDVAVSYRAIEMTREPGGRARLVMNIDKATLLAAPPYKATYIAKSN